MDREIKPYILKKSAKKKLAKESLPGMENVL